MDSSLKFASFSISQLKGHRFSCSCVTANTYQENNAIVQNRFSRIALKQPVTPAPATDSIHSARRADLMILRVPTGAEDDTMLWHHLQTIRADRQRSRRHKPHFTPVRSITPLLYLARLGSFDALYYRVVPTCNLVVIWGHSKLPPPRHPTTNRIHLLNICPRLLVCRDITEERNLL